MKNKNLKLMVEEAVKRMEALGAHPNVVNEFRTNGKVYVSEASSLHGTAGFILLDEYEKILVKRFEETHSSLVYHIVKRDTPQGVERVLLYVPSDEVWWEPELKKIVECVDKKQPIQVRGYVDIEAPDYYGSTQDGIKLVNVLGMGAFRRVE